MRLFILLKLAINSRDMTVGLKSDINITSHRFCLQFGGGGGRMGDTCILEFLVGTLGVYIGPLEGGGRGGMGGYSVSIMDTTAAMLKGCLMDTTAAMLKVNDSHA